MVSLRASADVEVCNSGHLRRLNLQRVLAVAMDRPGAFTRSELIEVTGLSAPTVGSVVSHLIRRGLLRSLGVGPSRGGRRPCFMEFNARHGFVAGIDLGPAWTRMAVADLRGQRLAERVMPTPSGLGPSALLRRIAAVAQGLLREAQVPPGRLLVVGAAAPGAVDRHHGMVVNLAPNLAGWEMVPMRDILRRALDAPVLVENDVNLAILGERWKGAARGHHTCAFISVGTGIGAGVVVQGELHRGHHSLAGEIAFMCMGPQYVERDFRPRGCLETLAGLKALAARWPAAGRSPRERWVGELFRAAQDGDRRARRAVAQTARLISMATANLSLVLDPSLIVLGGAMIAQAPQLVSDVRRLVAGILPTPTEIVPSALGEEAPLWGTLLVATAEAQALLRARLREPRLAAV
jgi:glucokinase